MPNPTGPHQSTPPLDQVHSPMAALLSYLVPGLGQISQGRVGKGILFLFCVYGLFFYGMAVGEWQNVYLPDNVERNDPLNLKDKSRVLANLYNRPQFAGQFWVGIAAWPAIGQYNSRNGLAFLGEFMRTPTEDTLNEMQTRGNKTFDLAWVYTVIAGVLNVLVIYDAFAGPAFTLEEEEKAPARRPQEATA